MDIEIEGRRYSISGMLKLDLKKEPEHQDNGAKPEDQGEQAAIKLIDIIPEYIKLNLDSICLCEKCFKNIEAAAADNRPAARLIMELFKNDKPGK